MHYNAYSLAYNWFPAEAVTLGLEFESYTVDEGNQVLVCGVVLKGSLNNTVALQLFTAVDLATSLRQGNMVCAVLCS